MKVYRYMSLAEFMKLMNGLPLCNPKKRNSTHTNSCGFCFLTETTAFNARDWNGMWKNYEYKPDDCSSFLDGIVSSEVLVEFEVQEPLCIRSGFGVYMNPVSVMYDVTIKITEYSCHAYDKTMLKPVRVKLGSLREPYVCWYRKPWIQISAQTE